MNMRRLWGAAFAAWMTIGTAVAQDYPNKQITIVVGFPAGGAVDAVGRILAQRLGDIFGKPVVVDNKSGASGSIAAQAVARAAPDGYTLLMTPLTSYVLTSTLLPAVAGYNLEKDYAPVTLVGLVPLVLMVNEGVPVKSTADLVALAKAKPGTLNFASSGNGSIEHVAGEMFNKRAGVSLVHVPYRGAAPAMADMLGGQVQLMFATVPTAVSNMAGGKIKPLMVAMPQRVGPLPDVPTTREAGYPGFEVASTYTVLAPAGTPPAVIRRLNAEIGKILQLPEVRSRFQTLGIEIVTSTPEEAAARVTAEIAKWGQAIRDSNIKAD